MAFYNSVGMEAILFGKNEYSYSGKEKRRIVCADIVLYFDSYGCKRFVMYKNGKAISGLQVMTNTQGLIVIQNVYTIEDERKKGYAKRLHQEATRFLNEKIYHSSNLSELGKIYANRVN